jgi:hypothetical protein
MLPSTPRARVVLVLLSYAVVSGCSRRADAPVGAGPDASAARAPAAGVARAAGSASPSPSNGGGPLLVRGKATGYSQLPDGLVVRTAEQACPNARPRQEECRSSRSRCTTDSECTAKPNGYCTDRGDSLGCGCQYGCVKDGDCGNNEVCLCGDPVGTCVAVTCTKEACVTPSQCATYHDGCAYKPFSCLEHAGTRTCTF